MMCIPKSVDVISPIKDERVTSALIMDAVCDEFEVSSGEMAGTRGTRHLTNARIAYAFFMRNKLNATLQFIGDQLNRHYGTVMYLLQKEKDYRFTKDDVISRINRIEQKLFKQTINP